MAQNYVELQGHLDRVRWAWKRAAALQGLSAVVMEGLGMFLLFALLDYFYVFPQYGRVMALTAMGAIAAFLFVRHVLRPLMRVIPDEQVAMYIEEREHQTQGALLSATTFGKDGQAADSPIYGYIVDHIVKSAVDKAGSIQLSRLLNLAKLRKYGIAAAVLLLFFGLSAIRFSNFFRGRAQRMLMPWNMTDEDKKAAGALLDTTPRTTFELTLNPAGNRILRGSALKVKAKLSRLAESDVELHFRTKGTATFQKLKMDEIDELNTFALRLPDINDTIELQIRSGMSVSDLATVNVYDQLEIKGYEVTLCPPPYTKQKPTTDFGPAADITALEGTVVKFRALANTALAKGELVFDDGTKVLLNGEKGKDNAAGGEFTVTKDAAYTVHLISVDEQKGDPSSSFTVRALKDEPPSVVVEEPQSDMAAHPAAEVLFKVKTTDDVGIASVDFFYAATDAQDKNEKISVKIDGEGAGDREGVVVLPLAQIQPALHPGDTLFYHFEVRDLKGQPAISDIYMLSVRPFEVAGAFPGTIIDHHAPHAPSLDLMVFIGAAWNIHGQKELIAADDYNQRCDGLAARMVQPNGDPVKLKKPKATMVPADKVYLIAKGDELVKKGIATLKAHDAGGATARFREAVAAWQAAGLSSDMQQKQEVQELGESSGNKMETVLDALGFMKMEVPKMEQTSPHYDINLPDYRRAIKPEEAKKLRDQAQELQRKEQQLIEEAKRIAALNEENKNNDNPNEKKDDPEKKGNPETAEAKKPGEDKPNQQQPTENKAAAGQPNPNADPKQQAAAKAPQGGNADPHQPQAPQKPGEQQANADKNNPANPANPANPEDAKNATPRGDQTADADERRQDLQHRQETLAAEARKLSKEMANATQKGDKDAKEVVEHFRKTTDQMDAAANEMKNGNMQQAAAHGEEAKKELHAAADKLQVSQFDNLDKAVEAADQRGAQVADTQKQIQVGMKQVLDDAKQRNKGETDKNGEPKLNNQDAQKMQGLARLQAENQKNAEDLEKYIGDLEKWADDMHKNDARDELRKAGRVMKQENLTSTMVTAAVNLGQQEVSDAKDAQDKLDKSLNKLTGALHSANNALAQTHEQKIKRALGDAKEILAKAEKLAGVEPEKGGANDNKKDEGKQTADAKNEGKGKDNEKKNGDDKHADANKGHDPATGEQKNGENKDGEKTADAHKPDPNGKPDAQKPDAKNGEGDPAKNGDKGDTRTADNKGAPSSDKNGQPKGEKGDKKELTPEERRVAQEEIRRDTQRLAKRLEEDKLATGPLTAQLSTLANDKSFEEMFKDAKNTKLDKYLGSLKTVSSHLESKLDSVLKAKRLSAAQREQTPIQYRDMVSKYYEQLSKE